MSHARTLVLLLALAACGGGSATSPYDSPSPPAPPPLPPPAPPPPPPPPGPGQGNVQMSSSNDGYGNAVHSFVPSSITITQNGSVTWTNGTGNLHNVTFGPTAGAPASISSFSSGSASRTFTTAGTFSYQCTNHIGMTGQVVVQ